MSEGGPRVSRICRTWLLGVAGSFANEVVRCNILNISAHGALVFSDSFPGLGEDVLLRLKRPVRSDWVASIVVRHDQQDEVAVDFKMDCSYDLELAATLGIDIISSVLGLSGRVDLGGRPPRPPTDPGLHITRTRFLIS